MKLNAKQTDLLNFLNNGGIIIQKNNRLWVNGEVLNSRTMVTLLYKLHGEDYIEAIKKVVKVVG